MQKNGLSYKVQSALSLLIDLLAFISLGVALPMGFKRGFCDIFGWSTLSENIGSWSGIIIGWFFFFMHIEHYKTNEELIKLNQKYKLLEYSYYSKESELRHTYSFLTEEQKHEIGSYKCPEYKECSEDEIRHISPKTSIRFTYIATAFLIASVLFYITGTNQGLNAKISFSNDTDGTYGDSSSMFVGSTKSSLVHWKTCRYAQNISNENRVYYDDVSEALADGRKRCSSCLSTEQTGTSVSPSSSPSSPGLSVRERLEAALADEKRYNQADHIRNVAGVREARKGNE